MILRAYLEFLSIKVCSVTYSCRWLLRKNKVNVSIVRESMLSFSTVPLFSVCVGGGGGGGGGKFKGKNRLHVNKCNRLDSLSVFMVLV